MDVNIKNKIKPKSFKRPFPWVGHLPFAAWLMEKVKPKIFVELGTHYGNSYFMFCQAAKQESINVKCHAVDTWQGEEHAGHYNEDVFNYVKKHNDDNYNNFSTLLRMTFDEALNNFSNGSIDILHIDGLHTYEAVKHDFETWLPKMAQNGIVLFHDTKVHDNDFGVWKLWSELIDEYKYTIEFDHSYGLGILQLGDTSEYEWMKFNEDEKNNFKNYFKESGEFFELSAKVEESKDEIKNYVQDIYAYRERLSRLEEEKNSEVKILLEDIYAYRERLSRLEEEKNSEVKILLEDIYAYRDKVEILEIKNDELKFKIKYYDNIINIIKNKNEIMIENGDVGFLYKAKKMYRKLKSGLFKR